ncbi:AraC family transcriptional regulator [bacterium]|nr:AraC family transcriptional regulator [bacterium]
MAETPRQKFQREEYTSRINRVIDYIENNLDRELSLKHLAAVANFSQFYFHRIFKAMVGETLNSFIQRIRVEKAAIQLIASPRKTITEVALDCGFSSSASFARVFKEFYNKSASQWRDEAGAENSKICKVKNNNRQSVSNNREEQSRVLSHIDPVTQNFIWRINMAGINDIQIEVKEMPEFHVAYVRHIGAYQADEDLFRELFERLMRWAVPRGLFKPPETLFLSTYHDDPKITEDDKLRVSVCMTVPENTEVDGEVGKMKIPGGKFAVARCEIQADQYEQAWDAVMGSWMPDSGYQPDDRLCYEMSLNNPDEHPEKLHIVNICVPVKPL